MSDHDLLTFLALIGSAILVCYLVAETTRAVAKNRIGQDEFPPYSEYLPAWRERTFGTESGEPTNSPTLSDAGEYVPPDEESALWWRDMERQGYL